MINPCQARQKHPGQTTYRQIGYHQFRLSVDIFLQYLRLFLMYPDVSPFFPHSVSLSLSLQKTAMQTQIAVEFTLADQ